MKNDARRLSMVLLVGLVLVNSVAVWLAFKTSNELQVAGHAIERTHAAYDQIDRLRNRLLAVETRHLVVMSHPDDAARQAYERAVVDAWDQLRLVRDLTHDDDPQQERLNDLGVSLRRHLMDLDAQVRSGEATQDPRHEAAIVSFLWELIRGEERLLDSRWATLAEVTARTRRSAMLAAALAILSLISAGALITRHLRVRATPHS